MALWAKYNTGTTFQFPMIKRGVVDFAVSADWTPASTDAAISKDNGNYADTTNTIAIVGGTPTRSVAVWKLALTATELSAATVTVQIVDAATKAVEDQSFTVYTYGNASAYFAGDWSDIVRLGLTSLPNAAAEASGGLYTRGTGAGQIKQTNNGEIDSNITRINNVVTTAVTTIKAVLGLAVDGVVTTVTNQLTAAQVATGVWQDTTAGDFTTALSIGKSVMNGVSLGTGLKIAECVLADTLTTYTGNTPQTGDSYARLGAPVGASISADIAEVEVETDDIAAIKAKTDNLPATPAAVGSAMTLTSGERNSIADAAFVRQMTESYASDTVAPTLAQALFSIQQNLQEFAIAGTTITVKKLDKSSIAETYTLDSSSSPTSRTRAT